MEQFDFEYEFEEDILDFLFNNYDVQNMDEDEYAEAMRESVDIYVSKNDDMHKDLVDEFGVFEAIKLYEQTYGRYEVLDNVSENYALLAFIIIYDQMIDKYGFEDAEDDERESVPVYFHKYTLVSIKEVE